MIKKTFMFVLMLCLTIIIGNQAFAQSCPNVVGDWDFTIQAASYDPLTNTYGYEEIKGVIHITDQNGCLFYGYSEVLPPHEGCPLTGVISHARAITVTSCDTTVNGILRGYDTSRGIFTIMEATFSNLEVVKGGEEDWQGTGTFNAIRR